MSKPPVKFGRLKVVGLGGKSSNTGRVSKTARGLGAKQGANTTPAKRNVNSNAVTGRSVVTKQSKMAPLTPNANGNSYATTKVPAGSDGMGGTTKATTPNNLTTRSNSPLNAVKPGRRALSKAGVLAKRPNPTNHMVKSPLTKSVGKPTTKQKTSPKNKYGYNHSFSPLS